MLKCEICGKELPIINHLHLRVHNFTVAMYKYVYPTASMCSDEYRHAISIANKKAWAENPDRVAGWTEYQKTHPNPLLGTTHISYTLGKKLNLSEAGRQRLVEEGKRLGLSNRGKKASPEAVASRAASLRGRSYEDLMGKEKADILKADRRRCLDWNNTPESRLRTALCGSMRHKELMETDPEYKERFGEKLRQGQKKRWDALDDEGRAKWMKGWQQAGIDAVRKKWREISDEERSAWIGKIMMGAKRKPNNLEAYIGEWLDSAYPDEWKYVGDGSFIIGGLAPDFINVNGKKQAVEIFGRYWHSKKLTGRTRKEEELWRKTKLAAYGYETLVIWEQDIRNDMAKVAERITAFAGGQSP